MRGLGADEEYWKGLREGVLKVQQCAGCGHWHVPSVWRCGECGGWELAWRTVEPKGTVFSWTRTWHSFGAPTELGSPLVVVVVEIPDAGRRRLVGTLSDPSFPVKIGQPVVGHVIEVGFEGERLPALRWTPVTVGVQA